MADSRTNVGFDGGDRVVSYGELDFVSYDDRGFVVRRGNQRYQVPVVMIFKISSPKIQGPIK
jgi:hypothetical protein